MTTDDTGDNCARVEPPSDAASVARVSIRLSGTRGDEYMGQVAYSIEDAARAAAVTKQVVEDAVRVGALPAHRIADHAVILATDIQGWLESFPYWA